MSDISLVEWGVYGFFAYSAIFLLCISVLKDLPTGRNQSITRMLYMIPGMICSAVLATSGANIIFPTMTESTLIKDLNTTSVWNQTSTYPSYVLITGGSTWSTVHFMFFMILFIYIVMQIIFLMKSIADSRKGID